MNTITVEELMKLNPETVTILDVRPEDEYRRGTFEGAVSMPMKAIPERKDEIPKEKPVYLLCHTGERSMEYVDYLEHQGYDAWNVEGGYRAYLRIQLASFVPGRGRPQGKDCGNRAQHH